MSESFFDPHAAEEAAIEHIVDTEGLSYYDAREKLGVEQPDNRDFTAQAIADRLGPAAMGEFEVDETVPEAEEPVEPHDGSNPKTGLNHQSWQKNSQTDEQKAAIQHGIKMAREEMARRKKQ